MKFTKLELWNFQSHEHSVFDFTGGVMGLEGPNDSGKSAVGRALEFVAQFEYDESYVRKEAIRDEQACRVALSFIDGKGREITVARQRTEKFDAAGKNVLVPKSQFYELIIDGVSKKFHALKNQQLPPEIEAVLRMQTVDFEDGVKINLNFAEQIPSRGPFLIGAGYSGQTRLKILGSLTEQHLFDEGARKLNSDKAGLAKEAKVLEQLFRDAQKEADGLAKEPDFQNMLQDLEASREHQDRLEVFVREGNGLLEQAASVFRKVRTIQQLHQLVERDIDSITDGLDRIEQNELTIRDGGALVRRAEERARTLEDVRRRLSRLPGLRGLRDGIGAIRDLERRAEEDLHLRHEDAETRRGTLRRLRAQLDLGAHRELAREIHEIHVRATDGRAILSRLGSIVARREDLTRRRKTLAASIEKARSDLATALASTSLCPFSPFKIEFQDACKKKYEV